MGVQLLPFRASEKFDGSLKLSTSSKFKASALKYANLFSILTQNLHFKKFNFNFSQKTRIELFSNPPPSLEMKSMMLQLTILTYFSNLDKNWVKNTENVNRNS